MYCILHSMLLTNPEWISQLHKYLTKYVSRWHPGGNVWHMLICIWRYIKWILYQTYSCLLHIPLFLHYLFRIILCKLRHKKFILTFAQKRNVYGNSRYILVGQVSEGRKHWNFDDKFSILSHICWKNVLQISDFF
jgi:hypothetical protein